jgi:hypothetical protein
MLITKVQNFIYLFIYSLIFLSCQRNRDKDHSEVEGGGGIPLITIRDCDAGEVFETFKVHALYQLNVSKSTEYPRFQFHMKLIDKNANDLDVFFSREDFGEKMAESQIGDKGIKVGDSVMLLHRETNVGSRFSVGSIQGVDIICLSKK